VSLEEMKVKNDLRDMLRKVIIFDAILAVILTSLVQFTFPKYSLVFLGGLVLALINFIINGIITEYMLLNKKSRYVLGNLLGFIVRVVLVCGIAIVIYKRDQLNVIAYMLGYSFHFISLTLYGIKINK
jgi:ATP synthase protein I